MCVCVRACERACVRVCVCVCVCERERERERDRQTDRHRQRQRDRERQRQRQRQTDRQTDRNRDRDRERCLLPDPGFEQTICRSRNKYLLKHPATPPARREKNKREGKPKRVCNVCPEICCNSREPTSSLQQGTDYTAIKVTVLILTASHFGFSCLVCLFVGLAAF